MTRELENIKGPVLKFCELIVDFIYKFKFEFLKFSKMFNSFIKF